VKYQKMNESQEMSTTTVFRSTRDGTNGKGTLKFQRRGSISGIISLSGIFGAIVPWI